jgi:MFS family permease
MLHDELTVDKLRSTHIPTFLHAVAQGITAPAVPVVGRMLGASDGVIGMMVAGVGLGKVLANVPAGRLISSQGPLASIVLGLAIYTAGTCLALLTSGWWGLLAAGVLWGAGTACFFVARTAFLTLSVPKERRGRMMSMVGGSFRWGGVVGPFLAGGIAHVVSMQWAIAAMLPCSVIALLSAWTAPDLSELSAAQRALRADEKRRGTGQDAGLAATAKAHWEVLLRVGVYACMTILLRNARRLLLPLAALNAGMTHGEVGVFVGVSQLVDACLFFVGGHVMDHYGRKYAAVPTSFFFGCSCLVLSFGNTPTWLWASCICFGVADMFGAGLLMTLVGDVSPATNPAPFLSLFRVIQDSGQLLSPIIVGYLSELVSFEEACIVTAWIGFANAIWCVVLVPESHARAPAPPVQTNHPARPDPPTGDAIEMDRSPYSPGHDVAVRCGSPTMEEEDEESAEGAQEVHRLVH